MWKLITGISPTVFVIAGTLFATTPLAYKAGHYLGHRAGFKAGQDALKASITQKVKEKQDASKVADDLARECARDPECRVLDDGFRRDDGLKPTR